MTGGVRRILFVHYTTPAILGGVEQVMAAHAAGLLAAGKDVAVLAGRGGAKPRGIRVIRVAEADSRHPVVERNLAALASGVRPPEHDALVHRLATKIRPHVARADRVVVHNVMTMPLNLALTEVLATLAREHAGRFIAWTHDISYFDERYAALRRKGAPWDLVTRAVPSQLTGLARDDIEVVTNGVDVGDVLGLAPTGLRLAQRLGLFDADPLLLLPVRLTRRKRIEAAIDATAVLRRRGRAAVLVVTGTAGPHDASNQAYLKELALRAKKVEGVHLLASLGLKIKYGTVVDLYALADVLVFPSESEGFGIPMLEAGLHRMPIVCSDIPALRETGGDVPLYVPPDASGEQIADAVERALDTPVMRMRVRAREHAWPRVLRERVLPVILGRTA